MCGSSQNKAFVSKQKIELNRDTEIFNGINSKRKGIIKRESLQKRTSLKISDLFISAMFAHSEIKLNDNNANGKQSDRKLKCCCRDRKY